MSPDRAAETRADPEEGFRPALVLMVGRALASAVTFLIPVILARRLDPALFGDYKRLFLVYATFWGIGQIGMAESLYYFLPHHPGKGGRLAVNAAGLLAVSGVLCVALLTFGRDTVAAVLGSPAVAEYLPLLGAYLGVMLVTAVLEVALVSRRRYLWASAVHVGTDVVRALAMIVPVVLGFGLYGLLLGSLVSALLRLAVVAVYLRREFPGDLRPDGALLRTQLAYALPFALAVAVEIAQSTLHQYVVSYRFDAATFALYAVGCLQIPIIDFLAGPACNVMMVRMGEARRRGERAPVLAAFEDTTRKLALFFFPLFGLFVAAAHDLIVFLFTEQYAASAPIFRLWCVVVLLAVFQTDGLIRVLAQTRYLLFVNVVRLILIAAVIGPLLAEFGLLGPVLATLLAAALAKVLMLARWKSSVGVSLAQLLPWAGLLRIALAATGATLAAAAAVAPMATAPLPRLAVLGLVHLAVYVALLLITGALTSGERQALLFRRDATPRGTPCVESPGS